jgi:hypothetical protein
MYLIEVKNRAKAIKNLNQPPKFLPMLGMEHIKNWGRANPSLVGGTFFGDDADIMGLKLADVPHWYAGPFDAGTVSVISGRLANIESYIDAQKNLYNRLGDDLESDIQSIVSTISRYQNVNPAPISAQYDEHLKKINRLATKIGKRPSISSDPTLRTLADQVASLIAPEIAAS